MDTFEHDDTARFTLFTKTLWTPLYEGNTSGYTVLLVPRYFDFVKLKAFFKSRNAQVAMISEYTEKRESQRLRTLYEANEVPVLMVTERALVFQKIRIRFARNLILYSLPESPDILDESLPGMLEVSNFDSIVKNRLIKIKQQASSKEKKLTPEEVEAECKKVLREGKDLKTANSNRGIMGLYSRYDALVMERLMGTDLFKKMLSADFKEVYTENP